jgi:hypothetical protein
VTVADDGGLKIDTTSQPHRLSRAADRAGGWSPEAIRENFSQRLRHAEQSGQLSRAEGQRLEAELTDLVSGTSYLDRRTGH